MTATAARWAAEVPFPAPPDDMDTPDDMDILSRTCPKCGAAAEWPDCTSCGHRFDESNETPSRQSLTLSYTLWPDLSGKSIQRMEAEWATLAQWIENQPPRESKEQCPLLKLAIFGDRCTGKGSLRNDANVLQGHGIEGDYDGGQITPEQAIERLESYGLRATIYTSWGHTTDAPRWRVLVPLARPVAPAERLAYAETLNGLLGGALAPESGVLSQSYYVGRNPAAEYKVLHAFDDPTDGYCLDEIDGIQAERVGFKKKAKPGDTDTGATSRGSQDDYLAELLAGDDVHGNALRIIGRMVREGLSDPTIKTVFQGLAVHVAAARGQERASELMGSELQRMIAGARTKGYASANKELAANAEPPPPESKLKLVSLSGFASAQLREPEYIIDPYIPRRVLTLFGGHGGEGKSYVGLAMAAHVAVGRPWGPLEVTQGRVVLVSLEDDEEIVLYRLARIATVYGLDPERIEENLIVLDGTDAEPLVFEFNDGGVRSVGPSHEGNRLLEIVKGERPDLLVIDNASDAFNGDENNRRQVRWFVRWLTGAVKPHNAAVLLLAHIDKASAKFGAKGNSYSGSTAWHNSARSRLALMEGEIRQEKLNHAAKLSDPIRLRWDEGVPVPDSSSRGDVAGQGLIHRAEDAALLKCIGIAIANGDAIPTATQGSSTAWRALEGYPEFTACFGTGDGKRRFRECLVRLSRAGRIRREMQETPSRRFTERWVLVHQEGTDSEPLSEDLAA